MEDLERVQTRLENIRTVEPILSALRTISLGSWQAAQKQQTAIQRYTRQLLKVLPALLPYLPSSGGIGQEGPWSRILSFLAAPIPRLPNNFPDNAQEMASAPKILALVLGSERGLCGRFNATLVKYTQEYLKAQGDSPVELAALGSRVTRLLERAGLTLAWSGRLPSTSLPSSQMAFDLTRRWLARYEARKLDAVDLIYNAYRGAGQYETQTRRLIPPPLPDTSAVSSDPEFLSPSWPPVIVETDPLGLYNRIIEQWTAISLYGRLLESTASEHSTRHQLMESATQNAEQLIEELNLVIQTNRRQSITREMQELAAGAGLIGPRSET